MTQTRPPDSSRRRRVARLSLWLIPAVAASVAAVVVAAPGEANAPLRNHAQARGKFIGVAVATGPLSGDATYRNIVSTEFNQITAENAMKWDATEPSQGNFNFSGADQIVNFAAQIGATVHGHTLVWHSQTPSWVQNLSSTALRAAMQNHISTVVGRYANNPVVTSWDVVNEVFEENGSLRQSFWLNKLGQSYIADAFHFARAADPDAKLCINDYNVEGINAKSNAMYNLVQSLRSQGVPIDCVGFQAHLATQYGFPSQLQQNIQRFVQLGVEVRITELDVRNQLPMDSNKEQLQITFYRNVVNACLAVNGCVGITLWGVDDGHSWVPGTFPGEGAPLLWDANYNKKPAYWAVHDALATGDPTWTTTTTTTSRPPTTTTTTSRPPTTTTTTSNPPTGGCQATYTLINEWPGGFQGEVRVTNTGSSATTSWTVTMNFPNGQSLYQIWNGETNLGGSGSYTVQNAYYNGTIPPGQSTTFGFLGNWNGANNSPSLTCSRTP